jgi:muramoyltetrapeptide carboxypeptidase LdcA involved in peptidoglycan recycling
VEEFIRPPALEKGDKVAVIATSSGVQKFSEVIDIGKNRLEERFGLETVIHDNVHKNTEFLNEHLEEKAEALMQAFEDPEIKGIVALTGGDQQIRIIKHLQPDRLKENPTRFYGLSDNTNLHIYLWNLGVQSFYGGQILDDLLAEGEIGEYTYNYLEKAFFQENLGELKPSDKFTDESHDLMAEDIKDERERFESPEWEFWNFEGDRIEGRLFGGCLEILDFQMSADRYLPETEDLEDEILVLETSEEAPSETEVKRFLMCIGERGLLKKFSAILVGRPVRKSLHEPEKSVQEKKEYHRRQNNRIKKEIERYAPDTPAIFNMDFGHTDPKIPLNLGGKIQIRPEENRVISK